MQSLLRNGIRGVAMAGLLFGAVHLRAQDAQIATPQASTEQVKSGNPVSDNLFGMVQRLDNATTLQFANKTVIGLGGDRSLWVVDGKQDKFDSYGNDANGYDAGLKLTFGNGRDLSWVRGTVLNDVNESDRFSYGVDFDVRMLSNSDMGLSLLGDLSSMHLSSDTGRHRNYGTGLNFNFLQDQNVFAMANSKGVNETSVQITGSGKKTVKFEENVSGSRVGYVYTNYKDHIASVFADNQDGMKSVWNTFVGWENVRFMGSYDPNLKTSWTQTYLTFGMGKLTDRTLTSQIMDQFVYAERANLIKGGLLDSDNTVRASTPPVYLATAGKPEHDLGQFIKFSWKVNPKDAGHNDFDMYGVTAFRSGLLITENITKDPLGKVHYGGGIGFKPWGHRSLPAVVLVVQTRNEVQGALVYTFSTK